MIFYFIILFLLLISFVKNRQKTIKALKISAKKLIKILPSILTMLILVSIVLHFLPKEKIALYLGTKNTFLSTIFASVFGSITMMPGFITFPLAGILREQNVPFMVISAFTTTLMMVGIITFPVERKYLGTTIAILRNALYFFIAIIVAVVTGFLFGEITI
ncbi:MAG: hypothetical protein HN952_05215 [Candidatus Cloacimonetes bacterium]|jgi:uncharacterized membrane protein YraQ (UPF0718 family)|nr:hypothetical protein [Candidatus Cloacimonadota bacterium]MBT6994340.1 hypothetical protein [Candidatus Cloacimonadota bacterium]MBT7469294.1 hypothetical protein [Candidatus Cloacimonadota bacterium]